MGRPSLAGPRRSQIIDGLRAAILKHGIAEASVQRIAAEANLPAGLVHHYFVSKEDLLIATVDQVVEDLRTPLRAELDVLDPERALARGLDFLFIELPADRDRSVLFAEIGVAALRRPQLRRRLAALNAEIVVGADRDARPPSRLSGSARRERRSRDDAHLSAVRGGRHLAIRFRRHQPAPAPTHGRGAGRPSPRSHQWKD